MVFRQPLEFSSRYGEPPARYSGNLLDIIDDILISGESESAHLEVLEEVQKRLFKSGL